MDKTQPAEAMSPPQIKASEALETQLTLFQVQFMTMTAAMQAGITSPRYSLPLSPLELGILKNLQIHELERMKLIKPQALDSVKPAWQLTDKGRLVVIYHLQIAADYHALIPSQPTNANA
jgi:hypothetical protein